MYKSSLQQIISDLETALNDAEKFDANNDAAGRRLRSAAQDARNKLQELRLSVQAERNARKSNN